MTALDPEEKQKRIDRLMDCTEEEIATQWVTVGTNMKEDYDKLKIEFIAHLVELDNIGLDPHFKTLDDGKVLVHLIKQDRNDSDGCLTCPMLKDNKCSIYDKRPLICRLYGVVENMKCRFGCKPTRYLTNKEGVALVSAVKKLEIDEYFSYDKKSMNGYRQ